MIVKVDKSFEKDVKKINNKSISQKVFVVINEIQGGFHFLKICHCETSVF